MKILVLADASSFHTERFVEELRRQECEVLLASLEESKHEYVQLKRKGFIRQLHYIRSVPELRRLIHFFEPDIISAHYVSGYGHIAAKARKIGSVPLALNLWGSDILIVPQKSFLHRYKTKYALEHGDYIIADSRYLIDEAVKLHPFSDYSVIPWGIEREYLSLHKDNYALTKPLKIIVPRAHEDVYNNLFIVESLRDMIVSDKIELTFPSFGSLFESFREKGRELVQDKIRYYDKCDRDEFLTMISHHDIYLSASLSDSSPVSLIEAMALGLIPVVGDIPGIREWLNSKNGFRFDLHDRQSLQRIIQLLLDADHEFEEMRVSNREKVVMNAIFENNIADQIMIFEKLLKRKVR